MDTNSIARFLYDLPIYFTDLRNDRLSKSGRVAGALEEMGGVVGMK
jgi:hypothetical protein